MGFYIETPAPRGKAQWLLDNAGALEVSAPAAGRPDSIPVVVVDNGPFEAAGIAYDEDEFKAFLRPDGRRRTFLLVPREQVLRLCPAVKPYLNW